MAAVDQRTDRPRTPVLERPPAGPRPTIAGLRPPLSIGERFEEGGNNFDALRLLAAMAVLFSHSFALTRTAPDPILALTAGHIDAGGGAVAAFFVISGFLVTRSVLTRSPWAYLQARLVRIWPALATVSVLQTLVLGTAVTTLPWVVYLRQPATWAGLRDAWAFDIQMTLPGVFEANPYPGVVNGSMWTLPIECTFYLLLPLLLLLGALRPRLIVLVTALSLVALGPGSAWFGLSWAAPGPFVLRSAPLYPMLSCLSFFLVGAALFVHRHDVPLSFGLAGCCLIALFASARTVSAEFVFHLTFPYLVLYAALAWRRVVWPRRLGDLSYGAYLYAFPVQQAVIAASSRPIGPYHLAAAAAPIALACAALSWWLVERPALRWKRSGSPSLSG